MGRQKKSEARIRITAVYPSGRAEISLLFIGRYFPFTKKRTRVLPVRFMKNCERKPE